MRKVALAVLASLLAGGCQTVIDPNFVLQMEAYRLTISSQREVDVAKARAEEARYQAMAVIAERSDGQTKSMAILALALSRGGEASTRPIEVTLPNIPRTAEDRALAWASVFAGPTTALISSYFGYQLGRTQSNNQAATTQASYNALVAFKPAPIDFSTLPVTTSTVTTTNTTNSNNTSTRSNVRNDDGNVIVGTGDIDNNRPVAIVPPVVPIVPVVQVVPVVTGP